VSAWDDLLEEQRHEVLDDLLARWHEWQQGARLSRGYSARSATCADYQTPASYHSAEDADEAVDEHNERVTMRAVQACVDSMHTELRAACYMLARNAAVGASVFRARPFDQAPTVMERARRALLDRLIEAGVIG
jgi:hypothetical protein